MTEMPTTPRMRRVIIVLRGIKDATLIWIIVSFLRDDFTVAFDWRLLVAVGVAACSLVSDFRMAAERRST